MYSLSSLEKDSISNDGSRARNARTTCAVSFSSKRPPIFSVTDRTLATSGFSDSSYDRRRPTSVRNIGFVSFIRSHFSYFSASLCRTTAPLAEALRRGCEQMTCRARPSTHSALAATRPDDRACSPPPRPAFSNRCSRRLRRASFSSYPPYLELPLSSNASRTVSASAL